MAEGAPFSPIGRKKIYDVIKQNCFFNEDHRNVPGLIAIALIYIFDEFYHRLMGGEYVETRGGAFPLVTVQFKAEMMNYNCFTQLYGLI